MNEDLRLLPLQGSELARAVDRVHTFELVVSALAVLLIAATIAYFCWRYRAGSSAPRPPRPDNDLRLEMLWSSVALAFFLVSFALGAKLYVHGKPPPESGALRVFVLGQQWMWKVQHATGEREIDSLHLPAGRTVELTLISDDVIHSFFGPAFRVKQDALPGRYTRLVFRPDQPGRYRLYCAEYCGREHSEMKGQIVVLEPDAYERWAAAREGTRRPAEEGRALYEELGCGACHDPGQVRGPVLDGLFGETVELEGGGTAVVDAAFVREAILRPRAHVSAGWEPTMPGYEDRLDEEQVHQLVEFVRELGRRPAPGEEDGR